MWPLHLLSGEFEQQRLGKCQGGHQLFPPRVFLFQVFEPPHFGWHHAALQVFQRKTVAWQISVFGQNISTFVPASAGLSANVMCSAVNFDHFIERGASFAGYRSPQTLMLAGQ